MKKTSYSLTSSVLAGVVTILITTGTAQASPCRLGDPPTEGEGFVEFVPVALHQKNAAGDAVVAGCGWVDLELDCGVVHNGNVSNCRYFKFHVQVQDMVDREPGDSGRTCISVMTPGTTTLRRMMCDTNSADWIPRGGYWTLDRTATGSPANFHWKLEIIRGDRTYTSGWIIFNHER
jgi:hypothetical protein